jgi:hypothetical protein
MAQAGVRMMRIFDGEPLCSSRVRTTATALLAVALSMLAAPVDAQDDKGPGRFLKVTDWTATINFESTASSESMQDDTHVQSKVAHVFRATAQLKPVQKFGSGFVEFEGVASVTGGMTDSCVTRSEDALNEWTTVAQSPTTDAKVTFEIEAPTDTYAFSVNFGQIVFDEKLVTTHEGARLETTDSGDGDTTAASQGDLPLPDTGLILEGSAGLEAVEGNRAGPCDLFNGSAPAKVTWRFEPTGATKNSLNLQGCAHLAVGGDEMIVAEGKPPGGSYRWRSDPPGIIDVDEADENSAIITGRSPGRTAVKVEYETPGGERLVASLRGSVVELRSVNGGAPVPEIGLKDADGNDAAPVSIPIDQVPQDPELLKFPVADAGIVTVANDGASLLLKGISEGSTTAQAETRCGAATGPVIALTVVRCTKETQERVREFNERLAKSEKEILDGLGEAVKKAQSLRNDPKYADALNSIKGNAVNAATSIAEALLLSQKYGAGLSHAGHSVEKALTVYNVGRSAVKGTVFNDQIQEALGFMGVLPGLNVVAALIEEGIYFNKFVGNASQIAGTEDELAELINQTDFDVKKLYELFQKHKRFCEANPAAPRQPPPQPPAKSTDPPPRPPKAGSGPKPPATDAPTGDSGDGSTGGGGDESRPPFEPPPPQPDAPPPSTGGFVIEDCGCSSYRTAAWGINVSGLQAVGSDLRRTQSCGKSFSGTTDVTRKAVEGLSTVPDRLTQAAAMPEAQAVPALQSILADMKAGSAKLEQFGREAATVKSSLDSCGQQPQQAGELVSKGIDVFEAATADVQRKSSAMLQQTAEGR